MGTPQTHHAEHSALIGAPAYVVFDVLAESPRWPAIFGPTVDIRDRQRNGEVERFELWAVVNDEVRSWRSRRVHDRNGGTIKFEQEHSQPPIAAMGGEWSLRPRSENLTEVVLRHRFAVVDDEPAAVARVREALDRNSGQELAAVGRVAELGYPIHEVVFSFTDTFTAPGSTGDVYDFVYRADLWPHRLPHVARVDLHEDRPGIQHLEMETSTADGSRHTTRSIRICSAPDRISYKQLVPPAPLLGHSGVWTFADRDGSVVMTAQHTVALDTAMVASALGPQVTLDAARRYVQDSLSANSMATLRHAAAVAAP